MPRQYEVEFANFTCTFGDNMVLLDLALDVVIPAFTEGLVRTYNATSYFFHNTELITLKKEDEVTILLTGQFIKNTILKREQIFENNGLVRDIKELRSSPSAIFVLILNNHRLIYLPETSNAPGLDTFEATADKFIKIKHRQYIDRLYREMRHQSKTEFRLSKKELLELYPYPDVDVIPLSSQTTLEEFIRQYRVLKTVQTKLIRTNNEITTDSLFTQIENSMNDIGSKRTMFSHHNPEGLDAEEAINMLQPINGKARINLDGRDVQGAKLKGDNHSFRLRVPVEKMDGPLDQVAIKLHDIFVNLIERGVLGSQEEEQAVNSKIQRIMAAYERKDE